VDFFEYQGENFFVLIDALSRFPEVFLTKDQSARTVHTLLQSLFSRYGVPKTIVSDNGPAFIEKNLNLWLQNINCKHLTIAPYHPASNGIAERFVRTIKEQLKCSSQNDYMSTINKFLMCYRNTPQSSTGIIPSILMFGRKVRTVHTVMSETPKVWVKEPLQKEFVPAEIVGELGKTMHVVRKEDGTIVKRHKEQIKFNPALFEQSEAKFPRAKTFIPRRSKRIRKKPDRHGYPKR